MVSKKSVKPYTYYHKDGSVWAKGSMAGGVMEGYWVWFRKGGTKMRAGHFENGKQVGKWTTYNSKGKIVKVTTINIKK
jgi:antitoxin component YwqK of YwqJK toxin-antitoxin module